MKEQPRRSIDVERLLAWTYREELSKAAILGWSYNPRSQVWDYGTRIDEGSGSGNYYASVFDVGNPHEDALLIHETVSELDKLTREWHEEDLAELILPDMPKQVQQSAGEAIRAHRVQMTALVVRFSKIGARPDWRIEPPVLRDEIGANGRPTWVVDREVKFTNDSGQTETRLVEESGYDPKQKRLRPGARTRKYWDPPLSLVVDGRLDYCHWHASLAWLVEELTPKLTAWIPTGPACAVLPWVTGEIAGPRILPALDLKAA